MNSFSGNAVNRHNMKAQLTLILVSICINALAQNHGQFYPIGEDPNIRYVSSYMTQETILFEANPTVRFSIYNNFELGLLENKKHTQAWYVSARPKLRMYIESSLPVKTPSYRVYLGTQHLLRLPNKKDPTRIKNYAGFSLETGHYSNGQAGCAFSTEFEDESAGCDSIYSSINSSTDLSEILNRKRGNFSTNQTELILNYRRYNLDDHYFPRQMHSFNLGYNLYHNKFLGVGGFGGFTDNDIKIYGRHRYLLGYEYMIAFEDEGASRISFKQNFEIIQGGHNDVNPIRSESIFTYYPFLNSQALGFFVSYIYGHDNYNFRFVDSGNQVTIGITWDQFSPLVLTNEI